MLLSPHKARETPTENDLAPTLAAPRGGDPDAIVF